MPLRSTGCLTCRKRKIRCDEKRPGCDRCATHGVPCPGYRADQPAGVEFKDQTTITAKRAQQRYKAKDAGSKAKSGWDVGGRTTPGWETSSSERSPRGSVASSSPGATTAPETDGQQLILFLPEKKKVALHSDALVSPIPLASPSVERARIYHEFVTSYFPRKRFGIESGYYNFFQAVAAKNSQQAALVQGMDALSLVHLGSLNRDQRLLKEAGKIYGTALRSLATSIARAEYIHDDDVLAAVATLALCELFEEIANMGEGWAKHVQGTNVLLAARGPESFQSELSLHVYENVKHGSLVWALISRKTPFLSTPEWREVAFRVRPEARQDPEALFYDIALQVPEVLERHDALDVESSSAVEDMDRILQLAAELEMKLRAWCSDWQDAATLDNMVDCEIRPIEDFATFASLVSDRTFDHAYLFPDFETGYLYSVYWMVMYALRSAIQSLQKQRHSVLIDWYPKAHDVVTEQELLGYILSLCKCIPFFIEPVSLSAGHIGVFLPLRTAALYFTDHGHWHWLKWIGAVRNNIFTKGLVPPSVPGRVSGLPINRPSVQEVKK